MAKKQYPLRVDPLLWEAVERWAADELRSVNGQMEYIIRDSLKRAGRLPKQLPPSRTNSRRGE
ncbi:Arc family DNA binding domain-containing protein [Bifidobacterium primatium]|uniref:Arc family DNA binding domain-containing protein n=1 Tax=Bifidobacterium primatium TaxID=2045438 RepID=A0A2M9H980_9BIFI|nr:Arc family DNA binding domain-containing protein [Bifidobacterium primatium]PJM73378.1 Arc family DNA binding domain-containing protein [Bifidobacterium primatium]